MKYRNEARRRYLQRISVAGVAYVATLAMALRFVAGGTVDGAAAYLLAALPAVAVVGVFWAIGRLLVEETDEFRRLLLARQCLVATAFTLSAATVWGFLENFDRVRHIDAFYVAVLWFAGLAIGSCVNSLTERDRPEAG